jgi:hypothetical protein
MPVNFVQVKQSLAAYTQQVKTHTAQQSSLENELWQVFESSSSQVDKLRAGIHQVANQVKRLWCACPTDEPLMTHRPCPDLPQNYTIMAADGSQIQPSRHKALPYCVVNVGVITAHMGSSEAPETNMHSRLVDYIDLFEDGMLANEDLVSLWRDHAERLALLDHAANLGSPVIALTDGLLGLYMGSRTNNETPLLANQIYAAYKALAEQGVMCAGYIDKPGSDLLGRMFSLLALPENERPSYDSKLRYFKGIPDAALLKNVLAEPGERSAIFEVISTQDRKSENDLAIHFFYLNLGAKGAPYLVKVEIPGWMVCFEDRINLLHAAILRETRVLDPHPYPYILHRAHELAVIHMDEHEEVERLLMEAYSKEGIPLGMQSNKQANKMITGRERPDE